MSTGRNDTRLELENETAGLLREAGRAPHLDEGEVATIRSAAHVAWRRQLAARPPAREVPRWQSRWGWGWAVAMAAVLLAVAVWRFAPHPAKLSSDEPPVVAWLESGQGFVEVETEGAAEVVLRQGTWVRTGSDGYASLRLGDPLRGVAGVQLRLDVDTRVRLLSDRSLELDRGATYIDTGNGATSTTAPIEILTALGRVADVGTRFEVRWLPDEEALQLRVRDGEVLFTPLDQTSLIGRESASAGMKLELYSDGRVERGAADLRGVSWDWVVRAAPPFELEGKTLAQFMTWLEAESNLSIQYHEASLAEESRGVILHGSIEGLAPTEALRLVLLGSGLRADFAQAESTGTVRIFAE